MKSPFKFLDSYTKEDRNIFFGRDQEITELYRRVFESKILLVYGISGTGKSSLINCGLVSRFDESDWLPVNVRRGNNIVESLDNAINKQAISPLKRNLTITEKLQSIYLDHFKPVYLVFDQFEELFIFGTLDERIEFIKLIKEIVRSKSQCRIILVIREEFLAGITEFEEVLPEIFSNRFRVEKMKRSNAILAVEGPCKVHNIKTESGFSEELVDKLIPSGQEIELTFLQIYLDRIFRIAADEKQENELLKFSKELLTKAGSVSDLLGQFLEEQIREMEDPETGMTILKSFISIQGTKKQMTESEILGSVGAFGTAITEPDLLKYLTKFVNLRILRERDEVGHFELRHDALAAKIYEQFTLSEKELLEVKQFVENAFQDFNARKTYLNKDDLNYLSTYEKRLFLPDYLKEFVLDSKYKLISQQRALRRLTTVVAMVFLVIVSAGVLFYFNKKGSSDIKNLTTLALLQEKADPMTSIITAFKIRERDSASTVVDGLILRSFYRLLQEKIVSCDSSFPKEFKPQTIPVKGSVTTIRLNRSRNQFYGWTDLDEIFTCAISNSLISSFIAENEITSVEMSDDGKYIAVIYKTSKGDVYAKNGRKMFSFKTTLNYLMNNRLVRFFPAGNYFMAVANGSNAVIYDSAGKNLYNLTGHTDRVNSIDISPDGRFVATVSCDKTGLIWNFNNKTRVFSPYDTLIRHTDFNYSTSPADFIGPGDTIWSCEFNKTGKYILTSSADSLLNIWTLNGTLRNEGFVYALSSIKGMHWYWPLWEGDRYNLFGPPDHSLKEYYEKICDASFAANDRAVITTSYSYNKVKKESSDGITRCKIMYFDGRTLISETQVQSNPYLLLGQKEAGSDDYQPVRLLEIAPDRKLFAAVSYEKDIINLVAADGYDQLNISGTFPFFSTNGKSLTYEYGKTLRHFPVDINEIYDLVFK